MRKILLTPLFFVLIISLVTASNVQIAKVSVVVINEPPKITGIGIVSLENYDLRCDVVVEDELEDVLISYKWYNGAERLMASESILTKDYFKVGDMITCRATANDFVQDSETKEVSITVKEAPLLEKLRYGYEMLRDSILLL